jgi:hypothetical protein
MCPMPALACSSPLTRARLAPALAALTAVGGLRRRAVRGVRPRSTPARAATPARPSTPTPHPDAAVELCLLDPTDTDPDYAQQLGCTRDYRGGGRAAPGGQHPRRALGQDGARSARRRSALLPEQPPLQDPLGVRVAAPVGQRQADRAAAGSVQPDRVLLARPPLPARRAELLRGAPASGPTRSRRTTRPAPPRSRRPSARSRRTCGSARR